MRPACAGDGRSGSVSKMLCGRCNRVTFSAVLGLVVVWALGSCSPSGRVKTEPDAVFVSTPHAAVLEMLRVAQVTKDDTVYDLGCGDGRIVIAAAKLFGAKGVGVEIDDKLLAKSRKFVIIAGVRILKWIL